MPKIPSVYALADEINEAAGKKVIRYAMHNGERTSPLSISDVES